MVDIAARCRQEIMTLHHFFVDWFMGNLAATEENFARLSDVLATGMVLISPDGSIQTRDQLLTGIRPAHGARADMTPPFQIWIEDFQLHHHSGDLALVTYVEWQIVAGQTNSRLSSALFREKEGAPNSVEWLHVHETGLMV